MAARVAASNAVPGGLSGELSTRRRAPGRAGEPAGDHDRAGGNREAELAGVERRDLLPERRDAHRRWIVRLSAAKRGLEALEQQPRNGKLARVEVADTQVADLPPAGLERP